MLFFPNIKHMNICFIMFLLNVYGIIMIVLTE